MNVATLLQRADIWRGRGRSPADPGRSLPTGFDALDARLPEGGWPAGALSELLVAQAGVGELRLVMPLLARLSRAGQWVAWVDPPHIPYAPALAGADVDLSRLIIIRTAASRDSLWAMEQALRHGACRALLGWPGRGADERRLRRLQLAAEQSGAAAFLFRPPQAAERPSPAALRLRVDADADGTVVEILKCRGGWQRGALHLAS